MVGIAPVRPFDDPAVIWARLSAVRSAFADQNAQGPVTICLIFWHVFQIAK
jgi:hypothetical protein